MAKKQYAPIPLPAVRDTRLSASHHRLLEAIAYHDRFGANGQACHAGHEKLAKLAAVHVTNIPRLAAELAEWGHLKISKDEADKRLRIYFVLGYEAEIPVQRTGDRSGKSSGEPTSQSAQIAGEPTNEFTGEPTRDSMVLKIGKSLSALETQAPRESEENKGRDLAKRSRDFVETIRSSAREDDPRSHPMRSDNTPHTSAFDDFEAMKGLPRLPLALLNRPKQRRRA